MEATNNRLRLLGFIGLGQDKDSGRIISAYAVPESLGPPLSARKAG